MTTPGATELLIVLVIVLLILGPKRLPGLGRQLGGGIREFKRSITGSPESPRERSEDSRRGSGGSTLEPHRPSDAESVDHPAAGDHRLG